jgi:5-methyltetrahydrofolate--homocysteine methyltransferase
MAEGADPNAVLVAKANCSFPEFIDGAIRYNGATPEFMADYARLARDAGARIIGGCCGTRPAHIQAMKGALDGYEPQEKPDLSTITARLGEVSNGAQAQRRGEMDPLTGAVSDTDVSRRERRCSHRTA